METNANVAEAQEQHRGIPADTFRARLRLARLHAGDLTIREAAERSGLNHASWANWEKGMEPRDKVDIVEAISESLGVDFYWLLRGGPLAREVKRRRSLRVIEGGTGRAGETKSGLARRSPRQRAVTMSMSCPTPLAHARSTEQAVAASESRTRRPARLFAHATDTGR